MKRNIEWALPILLLVFVIAQGRSVQATDQEKDIVKFQQQAGELQGQIRIFEPESGLLIVERNSVTYSFIVTPATKMVVGNQKAKIEDLVGLKGKSVTVKYRAERKGNKANEIVVP
jgi:hypothetical protein